MIRLIRNILLGLVALAAPAFATDYHIGTGQTYTTIAAFDWRSLTAGDHVYIHPGTYREMIWLSRSGTAGNPIIIEGVPDGEGNLPILDGDDMVIPPAYDGHLSEYDTGGGILAQGYGMVFLHWSSTEWGAEPNYITVKNFEIKNTTPESYSMTNSNGVIQAYPDGNAGVYIKTGNHILLENLVIHDVGNGIESQGSDEMIHDLTIRGCWLYEYGRTDDRLDREHGLYNETSGMVLEHSIVGPPRVGTAGSAIKDRGAGTVIRYNVIYANARAIDLVEPQNQAISGCTPGGAMEQEPNFSDSYVYGNTVINRNVGGRPYAGYLIHYGYDNCPTAPRDGTLHFYNNTVVHDLSSGDQYNSSLFDLAPTGKINARNNNILNMGTSYFHMAYHSKSTTTGTYNWLGGNYVSRPYQDVCTGYTAAAWNETATIIDGNVTSGVVVDAASNDVHIVAGSPLIDAGVSLPAVYATAGHAVDKQYLATRTYEARANTVDIGAYLYTEGAPPPAGRRYRYLSISGD